MKSYLVKKTTAIFAEDINWKQIEGMSLTANNGDGSAMFWTKCYLAYNDKGLFFRFEIEDDKINCVMKEYNSAIYNEETVELFIQPTADKTQYMEFEWNGIGGVFCAKVNNNLKGQTTLDFTEKNIIDSKIYATEYGWIVQGLLPAQLFFGEKFEGKWRFNAYRIKRAADKTQILFSYNNTMVDYFHIPDMFAVMEFEK